MVGVVTIISYGHLLFLPTQHLCHLLVNKHWLSFRKLPILVSMD